MRCFRMEVVAYSELGSGRFEIRPGEGRFEIGRGKLASRLGRVNQIPNSQRTGEKERWSSDGKSNGTKHSSLRTDRQMDERNE